MHNFPLLRFFVSLLQLSLLCIGVFSPPAHAVLIPDATYISVGASTPYGTNCRNGEGSIISQTPWEFVPTIFTRGTIYTGQVILRREFTVEYPYYTVLGKTLSLTNPSFNSSSLPPPTSIRAVGWYEGTNNSVGFGGAELLLNGASGAVDLRTRLAGGSPDISTGRFLRTGGHGPASPITPLAAGTTDFVPNSLTLTWIQEILMANPDLYSGGTVSSNGSIVLAYAADNALNQGGILDSPLGREIACFPTTSHPSSGVGLLTPYGAPPPPPLPKFSVPGCAVQSYNPSLVTLYTVDSNVITNLAVNSDTLSLRKFFTLQLYCEPYYTGVKMAFIDTNNPAGGNNYLVNNALISGSGTQANGVGMQIRYQGPPETIITFSNDSATSNNIATVTGTIITPPLPSNSLISSSSYIDVPFEVRYYRYGSTVSTGAVVSEMNVLFFYD